MDWLKKFFQDPGTLIAILSSGAIGLLVGFANGIIQKKHGGWGGFFGAIATGVVIAIITGLAVQDYVASETYRIAIIGACTVISDDIWAGLKALGQGLRVDPLGYLTRIIDALRGRPANPTTPKE